MLPIAAQIVDYGAEGWLWALFGLLTACMSTADRHRTRTVQPNAPRRLRALMPKHVGLMRLLACVIAAVVYVWQEQKEFAFS